MHHPTYQPDWPSVALGNPLLAPEMALNLPAFTPPSIPEETLRQSRVLVQIGLDAFHHVRWLNELEARYPTIQNHAAHQAALEKIERLFGAPPNTPDGDELAALIRAVSVYEDFCYPF